MKCLVTGANGLLGKSVVQALLNQGHSVRAVIRSSAGKESLPWIEDVELVHADLRRAGGLEKLFEGVDCTVHLAALVGGSDEAQFLAGPVATENLLNAMALSATTKLVFCSSFSVYNWKKAFLRLTETTPLEEGTSLYRRDGYAIAKTWQERVVREHAQAHHWPLIILRPGFIWGQGNEWCSGAGLKVGSHVLVNGPFRRLPITYTENCAEAFALAVDHLRTASSPQTRIYNVVDQDSITAWRFTGDYIRHSKLKLRRWPLPDLVFRALAGILALAALMLLGKHWKLPGIFMPNRYRARFASLRFPCRKIGSELGWSPKYTYVESLRRATGCE